MSDMTEPIGLYIHVPFCVKKCLYCDFYSLPLCSRESTVRKRYIDRVIANISAYSQHYDTVYFGGGTPSLLSVADFYRVLSAADIANGAEITIECNPESVTDEKLTGYHSAGINRISIGVQSFDDRELKMLGRAHDCDTAVRAVKGAYKSGFDNISVDLMLGLPFQSEKTVTDNIARAAELPVNHISAYMLKIEDGTPLLEDKALCDGVDDDCTAMYYEKANECLEKHGYMCYEISNFAKKGFECRHNLKYWHCEDYIGIGPSAHSCFGGKRFAVPDDLDAFIGSDRQPVYVTDNSPCGEEERLMLQIRLREGICPEDFGAMGERIRKNAEPLISHGFIEIKDARLTLTVKGCLVSNEIICRLVE
ncbi:MAG: radical SAM family heme chaperone HemW [Oscillospiraceae bacterium]|nr:radical SAM family heme chaperone HemW [Oscillospiraceae bacterium]